MTQSHCIVCGDRPVVAFKKNAFTVVRSPGCALEWLQPFPEAASAGTLYGSEYLDRWGMEGPEALAQVREMKEATYRSFFKEIRGHKRAGSLLDIGCALGFLLRVAGEEGFKPYGLDLNAEAIGIAREEFGERVETGRLGPNAFPGVQFDVVTMIDVLEHVPEPEAFLKTVRDRLAPGGIAVAVLPNASSLLRRILRRRWPHYAPEHLYYWSPANLSRFLSDRGWEVRGLRTGIRKT